MRIYVGNLSYEASEEDVRQVFAAHGQVTSVDIIKDKVSGQSKGFAFVEMPNKAEGEAAIAALHESQIRSRKINVSEARPRPGGGTGGRPR